MTHSALGRRGWIQATTTTTFTTTTLCVPLSLCHCSLQRTDGPGHCELPWAPTFRASPAAQGAPHAWVLLPSEGREDRVNVCPCNETELRLGCRVLDCGWQVAAVDREPGEGQVCCEPWPGQVALMTCLLFERMCVSPPQVRWEGAENTGCQVSAQPSLASAAMVMLKVCKLTVSVSEILGFVVPCNSSRTPRETCWVGFTCPEEPEYHFDKILVKRGYL